MKNSQVIYVKVNPGEYYYILSKIDIHNWV